MGMFPTGVEFIKQDKFVIKHNTRPWDSYWNVEKQTWGGLIDASKMTKEELDNIKLSETMEVINLDKVVGLK